MSTPGDNSLSSRFAADGLVRSALESSPDSILILDLAGTVQFVNRTGARMLGAGDQAAHVGAPWLNLCTEPDQPVAQAALASAARGETQRFTAPAPSEPGEVLRLDNIVSPLCDD